MKILLGVPEYPPYHIGGGGEVFKQLAKNYKNLGHDVVVIYGYYPTKLWGDKIKKYIKNGITFYQIPEIPYPKSMPFLRTVMPANFSAWWQLKNIIKKENLDVAHLHGYGLPFVNILSKILCKLKIKYVFTIHGYPESQNKRNIVIRTIWGIYIRFIMNKTLKKAKKITCVSDFIRKDTRNICLSKSVTIYNGIDFNDYRDIKLSVNIKEKYKIKDSDLVIFSLGRISEMKGFQEIIKIIPKLNDLGVNVKYLIAGNDDGYRHELLKQIRDLRIEEQVEFIGFLDLDMKKQYLDQSDIFAIPSLWEPFGLVALEGMILKKLIIYNDIGGLTEVLKGYKNKVSLENLDLTTLKNNNMADMADIKIEKFSWKKLSGEYIGHLK